MRSLTTAAGRLNSKARDGLEATTRIELVGVGIGSGTTRRAHAGCSVATTCDRRRVSSARRSSGWVEIVMVGVLVGTASMVAARIVVSGHVEGDREDV